MADLKEFLATKGFVPLQIGDAELTELTCRIQLGAKKEKILGELHSDDDTFGPDYQIPGAPALTGEALRRLRSREQKVEEIEKIFDLYDRLCAEEYDQIQTRLKDEGFDALGGLQHYQNSRPLFFAVGIIDPPSLLKKIRFDFKFLGLVQVVGGAQPELEDVLSKAEKLIDQRMGILAPLTKLVIAETFKKAGRANVPVIGAWSPRGVVKGGVVTSLGPHFPGYAIDINAASNPNLIEKAPAVDAVLDFLNVDPSMRVAKGLVTWAAVENNPGQAEAIALQAWTQLTAISVKLAKFVKDNLADYKKPPASDTTAFKPRRKLLDGLRSVFKGQAGLEALARDGVIDIGSLLTTVLIVAGMRWGGEWKGMDVMHFEVRNWNKKFTVPKCVVELQRQQARAASKPTPKPKRP